MRRYRNPRLQNNLSDLCKARGITLYGLAQQIGVGASTLTQIASGTHAMSGNVLVLCCDALDVTIQQMLRIEPKNAGIEPKNVGIEPKNEETGVSP